MWLYERTDSHCPKFLMSGIYNIIVYKTAQKCSVTWSDSVLTVAFWDISVIWVISSASTTYYLAETCIIFYVVSEHDSKLLGRRYRRFIHTISIFTINLRKRDVHRKQNYAWGSCISYAWYEHLLKKST